MTNCYVKLFTMDGEHQESSDYVHTCLEDARKANPDALILIYPENAMQSSVYMALSPSAQVNMITEHLGGANATYVEGDDEKEVYILTYSNAVFDAIRVLIHQSKLACELVDCSYVYYDVDTKTVEEVFVDLDEYGRLDRRPDGFFDNHSRMLSILMGDKPNKKDAQNATS